MTRKDLNGTFADKWKVSVSITPEDTVTIKYPDGEIENWEGGDALWFINSCLEWANEKGYKKASDAVLDFRRTKL